MMASFCFGRPVAPPLGELTESVPYDLPPSSAAFDAEFAMDLFGQINMNLPALVLLIARMTTGILVQNFSAAMPATLTQASR
jgi:hypothetical protein